MHNCNNEWNRESEEECKVSPNGFCTLLKWDRIVIGKRRKLEHLINSQTPL